MEVLTAVDEARVRALLESDSFFWLDLLSPSEEDLQALARLLDLHPAAAEDTREWEQLPRLDEYGDHVLLVVYSARIVAGTAEPVEVHVYISGGWVVTARRCETRLDELHQMLAGTDYDCEDLIVYHVLDALADDWDPVVDQIDRWVDEVEADVLNRTRQQQLTTIYRLKQQVGELLRHAVGQRTAMPAAVDRIHWLPGLTRGSREWLRDVVAHVAAVDSDLQRLSGDLWALTDTFFNANANRLNRLATLIAVGSVLFLVWTLVTSFFGQNFGYLVRSIDSRTDFLVLGVGGLALPTVVVGAVLWWRRRDWWG